MWYTEPVEPSFDPSASNVQDGTDGWYMYNVNANGGIDILTEGENLVRAISVRGGEWQSHSAVIVSLDVPYSQIDNVAFQSQDSDSDRYEISGTLVLTQGNAVPSATTFTGYWGTTKSSFYNITTADDGITTSGVSPVVFTVQASTVTSTVTTFLSSTAVGVVPIGVTHLLITASNDVGENRTHPTYMRIYDSTGNPGALPSGTALDVDIVDVDRNRGTLQGENDIFCCCCCCCCW
tara:strand:- start:86 stop:793 length:708 start_codon:yes stop_codon:yes gene_type:complete